MYGASPAASRAHATACPVPSGSACTANRTPSPAASRTASAAAPSPTTTMHSSTPASSAASITWRTIGLPARGCATFGSAERMRVPCPAAMTMATQLGFTCIVESWGGSSESFFNVVAGPVRYARDIIVRSTDRIGGS